MTTTAPITEHVLTLASGHQLRYATRGPASTHRRRVRPRLARLMALLRAGARRPPAHHLGGQRLTARLRRLRRPPDGYTPDDFAADVRELADHLDVTSAVFVGHSMGTLVVQRLAARTPRWWPASS